MSTFGKSYLEIHDKSQKVIDIIEILMTVNDYKRRKDNGPNEPRGYTSIRVKKQGDTIKEGNNDDDDPSSYIPKPNIRLNFSFLLYVYASALDGVMNFAQLVLNHGSPQISTVNN